MQRMSTLTVEARNDLHLTSSGVAHAVRPVVTFPPEDFTQTLSHTLPPSLASPATASTERDVYETTTGSAHGYQPLGTLLHQPPHKKAPGNWKVNHTLDTIQKLDVKPWRRPLTMGTQCSEMRAAYRAQPEAIPRVIPHSGDPRPPALADHMGEGPTKSLVPTTQNQKVRGRKYIPQNQAVLDRLEPYMTTNNWHHRSFTQQELDRYPKKDVPTYWQCEDYPKAWGHGMIGNPLPKRLARTDPGPMRDRTMFKSSTFIRHRPQTLEPVMNSLQSVYLDSYTAPTQEERRGLFHCPVQSTVKPKAVQPTLQHSVPHMYETTSGTYGKGPVTVV